MKSIFKAIKNIEFIKQYCKEAYEAGEARVEEDVHREEYCIGATCSCEGIKLDYEDFEQWYELNK